MIDREKKKRKKEDYYYYQTEQGDDRLVEKGATNFLPRHVVAAHMLGLSTVWMRGKSNQYFDLTVLIDRGGDKGTDAQLIIVHTNSFFFSFLLIGCCCCTAFMSHMEG